MRALIGWCLSRHGVIATLTLAALVLGTWQALRSPLDVFPEFVPSQVDIQTEAPGFASEQVEALVTKPIESALNGASGLAALRSESIPGLSVVTVTFVDGVDVHVARQGLSERLAELGSVLPAGVGAPRLSPLVSSTMDLLKIGLLSDKVDAFALRDAADWIIKPRLLAVPGVAHVIVFGGSVREIQIQPDSAKLTAFGLTLAEVADAARAALALHGAGYIDTAAQRVLIQSPTPAPDVDLLASAVVAERGAAAIKLGEIAQISLRPALKSGDALIMGKPGVLLSLASQYGANTLEVTHAVEGALADLQPALRAQGIALYPDLQRPANFIESALSHLKRSLVVAALLILAVLYLFLRDVRASLIAFIAIPLSLLAAVAVLDHLGQSLNTMTLGGFAVALGVLVDDAIIGIENILRRLRENAASATPAPPPSVMLEASLEVRAPVIYATIVVIAVFLPELFATSVQGHFVGPLAAAFILAVLASLMVAMTATPALCALLLSPRTAHAEPHWLAWLKTRQSRAVGVIVRRIPLTLGMLCVSSAATAMLLPFLGGTFMPDFREGHFVVQVTSSIPGTSLEAMLDVGRHISTEILALPYVKSVEQQVGRAEAGEDTWGPHRSELHVELRAGAGIDQTQAQQRLRTILTHYPGLQSEVVTFLGDRISESLNGETAQVAIKVFGNDLHTLDLVAQRLVGVLGNVRGVTDLQFKRESSTPTLAIRLPPATLAAAHLKAQDVLEQLESAYSGVRVGQTYAGTRTIDVVAILPDSARHDPATLGALLIPSPAGPIPLSQIAQIELGESRYTIAHDGGRRLVSVTFNIGHGSVAQVVAAAKRAIGTAVVLPAGVYLEFTGAAAAERQTRDELLLYSALALALIVLILIVAFRWRANTWLVLMNLPFSLIGSIAAIAVTGVGISLGTAVGLVTVFGLSARNAILLLAHYEHLVTVEGAEWSMDTVLRGAAERLTPILMTAGVTALGLVPLALGLRLPGQEIEGPMAVAVLGGLVSSTALNLLVLPALAWRYARTSITPRDSRESSRMPRPASAPP